MDRVALARKALEITTRAVLLKLRVEKPLRNRKVCEQIHLKQVNEIEKSLTAALEPLFREQLKSAAKKLRSLATPDNEKAWKNCGIGAGGFQPGNTCARGGSASYASKVELDGIEDSKLRGRVEDTLTELHGRYGVKLSKVSLDEMDRDVFDNASAAQMYSFTSSRYADGRKIEEMSHSLALDQNVWKNVDTLKAYQATLPDGYLADKSAAGMIRHEYAHALDKEYPQYRSLINDVYRDYKGKETVSTYSGSSAKEMVSEAFAHYLRQGSLENTGLEKLETVFKGWENGGKSRKGISDHTSESRIYIGDNRRTGFVADVVDETEDRQKVVGRLRQNSGNRATEADAGGDVWSDASKEIIGGLQLKKTRDYSCLMLEMPPALAAQIRQIGSDRIPDDALADDGREDWPHITVLYGFHTDSADAVLRDLVAFGPIQFTIGKISRFESEEYDVVKFDVESADLTRLRKIVEQHPHTNTHDGYRPHITLAYVKKGTAGYSGKTELTGQTFTADNLVFSSRNETKTQMRLDGAGALTKFTKNCGIGPGGFQPGNTCARGGGLKMLAFGGNVVDRRAGVSSHLHEIFGRNLTDDELAGVAGAPSGSKVESSLHLDDFDRVRGVYVDWTHSETGAKATRYLYRGLDGPKVSNQGFDIKDSGNGYGTQILKHQVDTAAKLGVPAIMTIAEKSDKKNGYYTWPRLGYDREIGGYARQLPTELQGAKRTSDLMRTEEGRAWWKKHGNTVELTFDVRNDSQSRNTLDAYYNAKFGTGTTATQTDGKSAGDDGRGRGNLGSNLGFDWGRKGAGEPLTASKLADQIFDPEDWDKELVDRALPVIAQSSCKAALAQMRVMGVDVRQLKSVKNCGTGSGGFKPGNRCAVGGGSWKDALGKSQNGYETGDGGFSDQVSADVFAKVVAARDAAVKAFHDIGVSVKGMNDIKVVAGERGGAHATGTGINHKHNDADEVEYEKVYAETKKSRDAGDVPLYAFQSLEDRMIHEIGHNIGRQMWDGSRKGNKLWKEWEKLFSENGDVSHLPSFYAQENSSEMFAESVLAIVKGYRFGGTTRNYDKQNPAVENFVRARMGLSPRDDTKSTKSTASEWLDSLDDDSDIDFPDTAFSTPYGPVSMRIATEMPMWMKDKIKDHIEETFAQDYWHGMNVTTHDDIRDFLKMSIGEGWSIADMADKIQTMLGGGDYAGWRARNIARTESGHALNGARSLSADALIDEMGSYGLPVVKSWLSVLGTTTRKEHADLDGVPADKDGLWTLVGIKIRWPGDIRLPAAQRCNCQCSLVVDLGIDSGTAQQLIDEYTERADKEAQMIAV